jgi:hypothetical protein
VAAHSYIEVGKHLMLACRQSYIPDLAALFTEDELRVQGDEYGYVTTVDQLRDRLQLHEYTAQRALQELEAVVRVWHGRHPNPGADAIGVPVRGMADLLAELHSYVNSTDQWAYYELPEDVRWELDTRTALRLALDLVDDLQLAVRYNLDELVSSGFLKRGTPITEQAREERHENLARDAPLVILTEGASDSQLLTEAVSVTHPHLVGFLRFMDFSGGAEGSAANLVKLVRSFIGAGIANRVVAIADNDTAAHDALCKLKLEGMPDGYRLLHYPDLPLLRSYPTLGPQVDDPVLMDVNGRAGSLEMYLGRELLTVDDALVPVQWTGYVEGQHAYQGAIAKQEKIRIQQTFRQKAKAARRQKAKAARDGIQLCGDGQDWSGVEAIVEAILAAFD